jgi:hypothetical protein
MRSCLGAHKTSRAHAMAAFAAFFALSASASPARADGADAAADAAFEQGRALLTQQRLAEACAKLEESDRLRPSGRAALNLADCFERRGTIASAHARFLDAAQRAVEAHRPDAEQHARARAARLEPRLPRVAIVVPASEDTADLAITHQGRPLPRAAWNVPEAVDPGTVHTYEATSRGKRYLAPANGVFDCDDKEADAFPGQGGYFFEPMASGSWDYDCNGTEDRDLLPYVLSCAAVAPAACAGSLQVLTVDGAGTTKLSDIKCGSDVRAYRCKLSGAGGCQVNEASFVGRDIGCR